MPFVINICLLAWWPSFPWSECAGGPVPFVINICLLAWWPSFCTNHEHSAGSVSIRQLCIRWINLLIIRDD